MHIIVHLSETFHYDSTTYINNSAFVNQIWIDLFSRFSEKREEIARKLFSDDERWEQCPDSFTKYQ